MVIHKGFEDVGNVSPYMMLVKAAGRAGTRVPLGTDEKIGPDSRKQDDTQANRSNLRREQVSTASMADPYIEITSLSESLNLVGSGAKGWNVECIGNPKLFV